MVWGIAFCLEGRAALEQGAQQGGWFFILRASQGSARQHHHTNDLVLVWVPLQAGDWTGDLLRSLPEYTLVTQWSLFHKQLKKTVAFFHPSLPVLCKSDARLHEDSYVCSNFCLYYIFLSFAGVPVKRRLKTLTFLKQLGQEYFSNLSLV